MTKQEVKQLCIKHGKSWAGFLAFMNGKTIGINEDGTEDFYKLDVGLFLGVDSKDLELDLHDDQCTKFCTGKCDCYVEM